MSVYQEKLARAVRKMIVLGLHQGDGWIGTRHISGTVVVPNVEGRNCAVTVDAEVCPRTKQCLTLTLTISPELEGTPIKHVVKEIRGLMIKEHYGWQQAFRPRAKRILTFSQLNAPPDPLKAKTALMREYGVRDVASLRRAIRDAVCRDAVHLLVSVTLRTTPDKVWPGGVDEGAEFVFDVMSRYPSLPCYTDFAFSRRVRPDTRTMRSMPVAFLPNGLVRYACAGQSGKVQFSDHVMVQSSVDMAGRNNCDNIAPLRMDGLTHKPRRPVAVPVAFAVYTHDLFYSRAYQPFASSGGHKPQLRRSLDAVRFGWCWGLLVQDPHSFIRSLVYL